MTLSLPPNTHTYHIYQEISEGKSLSTSYEKLKVNISQNRDFQDQCVLAFLSDYDHTTYLQNPSIQWRYSPNQTVASSTEVP
jgi:hypothetical protein